MEAEGSIGNQAPTPMEMQQAVEVFMRFRQKKETVLEGASDDIVTIFKLIPSVITSAIDRANVQAANEEVPVSND